MTEVTKIEHGELAHHAPADPMVSMIERLVLNPDADLDKLERMLAMKERMDANNARISFARALSQARAEIPPIIKEATVDFTSQKGRTHYQHETLAGIAKAIDPILARYGISYRFRTDQGNGGVRVTCIVQHSDGHAEETTLTGAPDQSGSKNGFQAVGSAVTYLQRYTLKAALGLSAEVDDDAQAATPRRDDPAPRQEQRPAQNDAPTPRQIADRLLVKINAAKGDKTALGALWEENKAAMSNLPDAEFQEVKAAFAKAAPKAPAPAIADDEIPY